MKYRRKKNAFTGLYDKAAAEICISDNCNDADYGADFSLS